MLPFIQVIHPQTDVWFHASQVDDWVLLNRFLHVNKADSPGSVSPGPFLSLQMDHKASENLLRRFEDLAGVKFTTGTTRGSSWIVWERSCGTKSFDYVPPRSGGLSWSDLDADSLIRRAFHRMVALGRAQATDELVRCTYSLRPWITQKYQFTETIQATFTLRNGSVTEEIPTVYDP